MTGALRTGDWAIALSIEAMPVCVRCCAGDPLRKKGFLPPSEFTDKPAGPRPMESVTLATIVEPMQLDFSSFIGPYLFSGMTDILNQPSGEPAWQ